MYEKVKKISCIGIGGSGLYYIAKFFLLLRKEVNGFDIKESERTKELKQLGAKIRYENPKDPFSSDTDMYIYSKQLPNEDLSLLERNNPSIKGWEVGELYEHLVELYEQKQLSEDENQAFINSDIAPLFNLDLSKMKYIGVTGTDGKTTTCTMTYHLLKSLGYKPGMISTVSVKIGDREIETGFHTTTPPAQDIYKFLKMMEDEGCTHAIIESTSHGLSMGRLAGIKFDAVAYTNITEEHLDYHKTWENLVDAKGRLITSHSKNSTIAILNADDERAYNLLKNKAEKVNIKTLPYSIHGKPSVLSSNSIVSNNGSIVFELSVDKLNNILPDKHIQSIKVNATLPILGVYNVSNFLAAFGLVVTTVDMTDESVPLKILDAIANFQTVKGRMEEVSSTEPDSKKDKHCNKSKPQVKVIVDFAHTPNALFQALFSAQKLVPRGNRLISVFGCAGKRDESKREKMGAIARNLADITIITAEDPRTESLKSINDKIESGWKNPLPILKKLIANTPELTETMHTIRGQEIYRFDDDEHNVKVRQDAINLAIDMAKPGDIVLITGKAHEQSLCFGVVEYPWSDFEAVKNALSNKNN